MCRRLLILALVLMSTTSLSAQQQPARWERWHPPVSLPAFPRDTPRAGRSGSTLGMVAGGLLGGAAGFAGGALLGSAIGGGNAICGDDACGLEEAAYGAVIGEAALLPLGVHLAHRRRGNYLLSLLASGGIAAVGVLAVDATNDGWPLVPVPIAQLISSILIERATSRP